MLLALFVHRQKPELYDKLKEGQEPKVCILFMTSLQDLFCFYMRMYNIRLDVKCKVGWTLSSAWLLRYVSQTHES